MKKERLLRSTILAGVAALSMGGAPVFAQDAVQTTQGEEEEEAAPSSERIVITGSRIRRSEFTSPKPLQIISGEVSREIGIFNAADALTESTVAAGLQVDTTFSGFVSDNGPGSSTIDLRGLGESRTLVLVNGRRLGPSGVEGGPGLADLNMIPGSMIERIDVLLDGASSIYGSDAVAGVVNAVLRQDFEGLEVDFARSQPFESGGEETRLGLSWGVNGDRGFAGFGVEYRHQEPLRLTDRDIFGNCRTPVEVDENGNIRRQNFAGPDGLFDQSEAFCNNSFGINRMWIDPLPGEWQRQFGSLYYTPGFSNVGIGQFSELSLFDRGVQGDQWFLADGDAQFTNDVDAFDQFYQFAGTPQERDRDVIADQEFISMLSYGEYELQRWGNMRAYYEVGFVNRQQTQVTSGSRAFQVNLPGDNPFNPCNPDGIYFVSDCGTAFDDAVEGIFGGRLADFNLPTPFTGPRPVSSEVRVNVPGGDRTESEVTQFRLVGGLTGDLPFEFIRNGFWDIAASYDRSTGTATRFGWNDDRLALALATTIEDPNNPGNFICGLDVNGDGIPDPGQAFPGNAGNTAPDCIAVNPFSPTLFQTGGGNFATQEEFDFLWTRRTFSTVVEQTIINGVFGGEIFELPGGDANAVLGFEYRQDTIDSRPDFVANNGVIAGFFSDRGASGSRDLYEVFGELELPLISGRQLVEELTVNASARYTEESNFGEGFTYSLSTVYRPTDYLTFRGSYGTSFRAPNLREQFLAGQSGFLSVTDPCVVPEGAVGQDMNGLDAYDPSGDTRSNIVLDNCRAAGVDPTALGLGQSAARTIEVFRSGSPENLQEETSTSWTAGFVFEQPFTDFLDITFGATYYDIQVEDTLVLTSTTLIINDCYSEQPNQTSAFCSLITRDELGFLSEVDAPFVNQDEETAQGIDFNVLVTKDDILFRGEELALTLDLRANHTLERESTVRAPGSDPVTDDNAGEIYTPEWNASARLAADYGDWRFTWNTRWIGEQQQDNTDAFSNVTDTCVEAVTGDLTCTDVDFIDDYFRHDVSVRYSRDTWTAVVGISNVLDEEPPLVDGSEATLISRTNVPFNYDILGRRVFVNLSRSF